MNVAELKMLAVLEAAVASFTAKKAVAISASLRIAASGRSQGTLPILLGNNCYIAMYIAGYSCCQCGNIVVCISGKKQDNLNIASCTYCL